MNKQELKDILKPLIKEAVRDVILETGVLSKIITEVVTGLNTSNLHQYSTKTIAPQRESEMMSKKVIESRAAFKEAAGERNRLLEENLKKMVGKSGFEKAFEGVTPLTEGGPPEQKHSALREMDPGDKGIDVSKIVNLVGGKQTWTKQLNNNKKKEE